MAKRFFTILVLPDATSPARKFQISKTVMTVVSSVVAVSILALTFFLYQYVNLNVRMLELRQLRQEVMFLENSSDGSRSAPKQNI